MQTKWRQALLSGALWQDQMKWAQTETQKVLSEHEETLFHCEGDQALTQIAQGGCRVSILWDIQKLSGHGPGWLALDGPASGVSLDQKTSGSRFQSQLFLDSVIYFE